MIRTYAKYSRHSENVHATSIFGQICKGLAQTYRSNQTEIVRGCNPLKQKWIECMAFWPNLRMKKKECCNYSTPFVNFIRNISKKWIYAEKRIEKFPAGVSYPQAHVAIYFDRRSSQISHIIFHTSFHHSVFTEKKWAGYLFGSVHTFGFYMCTYI